MWHRHACQGNSETAFLTLIILYASSFSTISDPYQCFSSFHDSRAEIIMVEPERIMLQNPSYCYQWIFVLLQPTEIMVWAACTAVKCISMCRSIIKDWLKVHSIKEEFRTKNKRNFLECSARHIRVSRRFSVQGWRAFLRWQWFVQSSKMRAPGSDCFLWIFSRGKSWCWQNN